MKNKKLTIINKEQFTNLYRLGDINIHKDFIVQDDEIFDLLNLFKCEFDEDYLILEINYNKNINNAFYNLKIINVNKIFALSQKAQNYFKPKFNQNINFYIYPDNSILEKIKEQREIENINKGIDVFINKYDFMNLNKIEEKIGMNFIKESLVQFSKDNLKEKYISFYFDLLKYKREGFFPNKSVQYLYDLMIIIILKSRDEKAIEKYVNGKFSLDKSPSYQKLSLSNHDTLTELIHFIKNSEDEDIHKFINAMDGIENIIIGSIYLNLKDLLNEKKVNYQEKLENIIDSFSKEYQDELSVALYFIGLFFGYKNLYSDYYDSLDLNIFKEEDNSNNILTNEEELESKISKLKQENEELSKKIEGLESSTQNNNLYNETLQNSNNSNQTGLINQIKEENELLKKQLEGKVQSEKGLKEELEQKNQELLKQTQQLKDSNHNSCNLDNEITSEDNTVTEKEVHMQKNDSNKFIESIEKQDEQFNHKENYQEPSEAQNQQKKLDNEDMNKESFPFTDEEIIKFPRSHLQEIAKARGVETPTSEKKFPKGPEGQIALYNAIKASQKLDI